MFETYKVLTTQCILKNSFVFLLIHMLNLLSTLIGVLAVLSTIIAFVPIFGWVYWVIVPLALFGAVLGLLSEKTTGRNLNLVVVLIGIFTLFLGSGLS
jgi:hypothetical protein